MADASPPADGAAAMRWDDRDGVQQQGGEGFDEAPHAESPHSWDYLDGNVGDEHGDQSLGEIDGVAGSGGGWGMDRGANRREEYTPEASSGGFAGHGEEVERAHKYTEEEEDDDEDEDDDWMAAHLATLETKRRESSSMQEVEASVRAALSILNQSSDGAATSQQEDEEDEEEEGDVEGEGESGGGRARYFDFVQEAMEARWSLGSPNQNLLRDEGTRALRPEVHEIQESDEEEEGEEEDKEERADAVVNSGDGVANGPSVDNNSVETGTAGDGKALDAEAAGEQAEDEWQEAYTAKGRVYYYNRRTRESSWNKPAKFQASSRPQSPETGSGAPHRAVARQSLGYHASHSDSPRSLRDQQHLFCCFCGSKHEPREFQVHFRECKSLNFHKKQSSELYRGFQKMLTVLSEDSSLRAMHYASSFPDAQPVPVLQDNLLLLRRHQSKQRSRPSSAATHQKQPLRSATRPVRGGRTRTNGAKTQPRPARIGSVPTLNNSAGARAKVSSGFDVETCRYCNRSFAEGRLAKHEAVCPRVFGNEGSWGRGTPSPAATAAGSAAGQATTSPASKRRGTARLKLKTAKSLGDAHTLEASYKEHQAALVVCPCCRRKFAPSGAQQHIAICKSVQNRPKNPIPMLKDYAIAG